MLDIVSFGLVLELFGPNTFFLLRGENFNSNYLVLFVVQNIDFGSRLVFFDQRHR